MTEADYNNQIAENRNKISACNANIRKLEADIEKYQQMKKEYGELKDKLQDAAGNALKKTEGWTHFFSIVTVVLNEGFFSGFRNAIKGSEYRSAVKGLDDAREKIEKKIQELKRQIDQNQIKIRSYNTSISSLQSQKAEYLRKQEENKD